jgi:hypothetical protein
MLAVPFPTAFATTMKSWREVTVLDLLDGRILIRPLQQKNKELAGFIVSHCPELLEYTFADPESQLSKKAFLLLCNRSKAIVRALLRNDLFLVKATEVLMKLDVSLCLVSRLAILSGNIIAKSDPTTDLIAFLLPLLRFIEVPSVFSLFTDMCTPSCRFANLQAILVQAKFSRLVSSEFQGNGSSEKIVNLTAVVHNCLTNPIFHPSFASEPILCAISRLLISGDVAVMNLAWQVIVCACNEVTVSKMLDIKKLALTMVSKIETLHIFHTSAIELLGKIVRYAPGWFEEGQGNELMQVLVRIILDFPNATNLIAAAFRCIRYAAKSGRFLGLVLTGVFPVLIGQAEGGARTTAAAMSLELLADAWESRRENKSVKTFLKKNRVFSGFLQQKFGNV